VSDRPDGGEANGVVESGFAQPHEIEFDNRIGFSEISSMTKPHRGLKKANHGSRPANSKARKLKRKHIRT
jgi:hypothetical protein